MTPCMNIDRWYLNTAIINVINYACAFDTKKLNKLIQKAGFVLGTALEPLDLVVGQ